MLKQWVMVVDPQITDSGVSNESSACGKLLGQKVVTIEPRLLLWVVWHACMHAGMDVRTGFCGEHLVWGPKD